MQRNFHLTGFQFGEVEDVVDDREERLARIGDALDIAASLAVQTGLAIQQLRISKYARQGRSQFVAHIGEELAFDRSRAFRLSARLFHLEFHLLAHSDVTQHVRDHQGSVGVRRPGQSRARFNPDDPAVLCDVPMLDPLSGR